MSFASRISKRLSKSLSGNSSGSSSSSSGFSGDVSRNRSSSKSKKEGKSVPGVREATKVVGAYGYLREEGEVDALSGWLEKKGDKGPVKAYKKRYFRLESGDELTYYKKEPVKAVSLLDMMLLEDDEADLSSSGVVGSSSPSTVPSSSPPSTSVSNTSSSSSSSSSYVSAAVNIKKRTDASAGAGAAGSPSPQDASSFSLTSSSSRRRARADDASDADSANCAESWSLRDTASGREGSSTGGGGAFGGLGVIALADAEPRVRELTDFWPTAFGIEIFQKNRLYVLRAYSMEEKNRWRTALNALFADLNSESTEQALVQLMRRQKVPSLPPALAMVPLFELVRSLSVESDSRDSAEEGIEQQNESLEAVRRAFALGFTVIATPKEALLHLICVLIDLYPDLLELSDKIIIARLGLKKEAAAAASSAAKPRGPGQAPTDVTVQEELLEDVKRTRAELRRRQSDSEASSVPEKESTIRLLAEFHQSFGPSTALGALQFAKHWIESCHDWLNDAFVAPHGPVILRRLVACLLSSPALGEATDEARKILSLMQDKINMCQFTPVKEIVELWQSFALQKSMSLLDDAPDPCGWDPSDYERVEAMERSTEIIFELEPVEVVRQLTMFEFDMFHSVEHRELLRYAETPSSGDTAAAASDADCASSGSPNILALLEHSEAMTRWFISEILSRSGLSTRAAVLERVIELANQASQLRNYHLMTEIVDALQHDAIYRLRKTWEAIGEEARSTFMRLRLVASSARSFSRLRDLWQRSPEDEPVLPPLRLFLNDARFVSEHWPSAAQAETVPFVKCCHAAFVIDQLQRAQRHPFNFEEIEQIMERIKVLRDEAMDFLSISRISLEVEKREQR